MASAADSPCWKLRVRLGQAHAPLDIDLPNGPRTTIGELTAAVVEAHSKTARSSTGGALPRDARLKFIVAGRLIQGAACAAPPSRSSDAPGALGDSATVAALGIADRQMLHALVVLPPSTSVPRHAASPLGHYVAADATGRNHALPQPPAVPGPLVATEEGGRQDAVHAVNALLRDLADAARREPVRRQGALDRRRNTLTAVEPPWASTDILRLLASLPPAFEADWEEYAQGLGEPVTWWEAPGISCRAAASTAWPQDTSFLSHASPVADSAVVDMPSADEADSGRRGGVEDANVVDPPLPPPRLMRLVDTDRAEPAPPQPDTTAALLRHRAAMGVGSDLIDAPVAPMTLRFWQRGGWSSWDVVALFLAILLGPIALGCSFLGRATGQGWATGRRTNTATAATRPQLPALTRADRWAGVLQVAAMLNLAASFYRFGSYPVSVLVENH